MFIRWVFTGLLILNKYILVENIYFVKITNTSTNVSTSHQFMWTWYLVVTVVVSA